MGLGTSSERRFLHRPHHFLAEHKNNSVHRPIQPICGHIRHRCSFFPTEYTGHIFRLDISDPAQPGSPELWLEIAGPNGLVIRDGEMYVASYSPDGEAKSEHVIYRIPDLQNPVAEPFVTLPGQYDGIAFSGDGKWLYVTNWAPAGVTVQSRARNIIAIYFLMHIIVVVVYRLTFSIFPITSRVSS